MIAFIIYFVEIHTTVCSDSLLSSSPVYIMVDVIVSLLSQAPAFKYDNRSNLRLSCRRNNNNNNSQFIFGADCVDVVIASTRLRLFVRASDTLVKDNYVFGI